MTEKKKSPQKDEKQIIRELSDLLKETGLTEIEIETHGMRVRVSRAGGAATVVHAAAPVHVAPGTGTGPAPKGGDLATHPGAVHSPMVGTAYVSPQPGAAPFVHVGSTVTEGQTLLIVEAMKTMNPIVAPRAGRVRQILVNDAQPVEFGETLMIIE